MTTVSLILAATIFVGVLYLLQYFSQIFKMYRTAKGLPGPKGLPIIGNAHILIGEMEGLSNVFMKINPIYPSLFRLWVGPRLFVVIYDPALLKILFNSSSAVYKGDEYDYFKPYLGEGLLTAPVSKWRNNRKFLSQAFNLEALKTFVDKFDKHANVFTQKLESLNGEEVEIHNYIFFCTMDMLCATTMDCEVNTQTGQYSSFPHYIISAMKIITARVFKPWLQPDIIFKKLSLAKQQQTYVDYHKIFADEIIRMKMTAPEAHRIEKPSRDGTGTFIEKEENLKLFINLAMELSKNGEQISETVFRDEINTLIVAGTDTTSNATSFIFLMLATFPEVQDKVYQELYEIYGSSDPSEVPIKYDDLQRMDYLDRVIKETLRLFPAGPLVLRRIMEDIKVDDNLTIPKGSKVVAAVLILHRNKEFWPEPLKFDPDRFLPENTADRHPFSYVPFSAGVRNCIGAKYAIANMKMITATTLRKFIMTIDKPMAIEDIELLMCLTLKPLKPIKLRFKKRH